MMNSLIFRNCPDSETALRPDRMDKSVGAASVI